MRANNRFQSLSALAATGLTVGALVIGGNVLAAEPGTDELAKRLATLRAEVESLSQEVSNEQLELQNDLKAQARQKAEIQVEIQRETMRLKKVRQAVSEKSEALATLEKQDTALRPSYQAASTKVRSYVESALPFRRAERLDALDKLDEQFKSGLLNPERALARLWSFVEDEFRMSGESGLFRQTIEIGGDQHLADVVRLGTIALFYKTGEGLMGHAQKGTDGKWSYQALDSLEDKKMVEAMFDSFRKQIRVGLFSVPAVLPTVQKGTAQ